MNDRIEQIESEIAKKRAELLDLEIAARVLRSLPPLPHQYHVPNAPKESEVIAVHQNVVKSLSGATMAECAEIIISEFGQMHYGDITKEAIKRGYKSPKGGNAETMATSFWATLSRKRQIFESVGHGVYRLVDNFGEAKNATK